MRAIGPRSNFPEPSLLFEWWLMGKQSILVAVVDDDQAIRKALQRLFSALDFDAETFASGQEFLDSLATKRPDCVVIDLHMPGLTGSDILRRLALGNVRVPTIIITAHDAPESRTQCLAAGAAAYLRKPFNDQVLLDAIAKAVAGTPNPVE
jgi:FixJ family two-component response regulator